MKKILSMLLLASVVALSSITVFADSQITVLVDGTQVDYPTAPVIQNGSTLVPLRQTFQALGSTVDWDNSTQTITANKDDITITLTIGSNTAYKNSNSFNVSVAPQIINGSTFVPLRFVAESFGSTVGWDNATQVVTIVSEKEIDVENTTTSETTTTETPTVSTNITTNLELLKYLENNYSIVHTTIGDIKLNFTTLENTFTFLPADYYITAQADIIDGVRFSTLEYSTQYTEAEKDLTREELKQHMYTLANDIIEKMPDKKITGCYDESFYKYPNIQQDLQVYKYYEWVNYTPNSAFDDYSKTKVSSFQWVD